MNMLGRHILGALLFSLLCTSFGYAQETITISLYNPSYQAGETVQAEITLTNSTQPLSSAEILILDDQGDDLGIAPLLLSTFNNTYALYFDLPLSLAEGNYTLQVRTTQAPFTLTSTSNTVLAFSPAFILLQKNQKTFQVQVENKQATTQISFSTTEEITHPYTTLQTVQGGTKRMFKFSFDWSMPRNKMPSLVITYENASYTIPVFFPAVAPPPSQQAQQGALSLLTSVAKVNKTISPTEMTSGPLDFKNTGNATLYNITAIVTGNLNVVVTVNTTLFAELAPNERQTAFFWVNKEQNALPGTYSGDILLKSGTAEVVLPMLIIVQEATIPEETNESLPPLEQEEEPNITIFPIGPRPEPEPKKQEVKIGVLVFIVVFVLGVILFFVFKGRKTTQRKTFGEYMGSRRV